MGDVGTLESQWTSGVPLALPICQGFPVASGCWHALQTLLAWGIVRGDNHCQNPGAEASQTSAPFFRQFREVLNNVSLASNAALHVPEGLGFLAPIPSSS